MNFESFKQETDKTSLNYDEQPAGISCPCEMPNTCYCGPIYECPRENVCHRYICYDVPHIMPINTRIINHHIYRHTYSPEYTCCEENVVENVCCNNNKFICK